MITQIENTFTLYEQKRSKIQRGIITKEHIDLVTKGLGLQNLTDQELSLMWEAVHDFFIDKMVVKDDNGEMISWKPFSHDMSFFRDTQSAWLEVVSMEARKRKKSAIHP